MADSLDKPKADLTDLNVPIIRNNPTWEDMFDVLSQVMESNVESPIEQLEQIRFISEETDDEILKRTARLLGFDLTQDVLNLNRDNLIKLVSQLPLYQEQNGTEVFSKFIDLILNSQTLIEFLYTKDYVNFYTEPQKSAGDKTEGFEHLLIKNGGQWFKTTHINLSIALINAETLSLNQGVKLIDRVKELFYNFAPIALVVHKTNFVDIMEETSLGFAVSMPVVEAIVVIE